MDDKTRTDYDVSVLEEDSRFTRCRKEFFGTQIIATFLLVMSIILAYVVGKGDVSSYSYTLGYPTWYIVAEIVCLVGACCGLIFAGKVMDKCSLDAVVEKEDKKS